MVAVVSESAIVAPVVLGRSVCSVLDILVVDAGVILFVLVVSGSVLE